MIGLVPLRNKAVGGAALLLSACALMAFSGPLSAKSLYIHNISPPLVSDIRARSVGDIVTVVVLESSRATNASTNSSSKDQSLRGSISGGSLAEDGNLSFGGGFTGRGAIERRGEMVAQLSASVTQVLPNGDLLIEGAQQLVLNGDLTTIKVRGRIRQFDIASDNRILSSRIADAEIDYDGKGFVSRSAKPGLVSRIFRFLGLS